LRRAGQAFSAVERRRGEAIYRAHKGGMSLRAIARETDLSHETVRGIIARIERWVEVEAAWFERYDEHGSFGWNARDRS
jgi:lambda repressor-like predicted transcriptional regulator